MKESVRMNEGGTFLSLVEVHALPRDAVLGGEALLLADWLIWALVQGRGVEVAPPLVVLLVLVSGMSPVGVK